jgi:predicted amidophosphoribosyltransferase
MNSLSTLFCFHCGSIFVSSGLGLCATCLKILETHRFKTKTHYGPVSLFDWRRDESLLVSKLLNRLKVKHKILAKSWGRELFLAFEYEQLYLSAQSIDWSKTTYIIYPPSTTRSGNDNNTQFLALGFAAACEIRCRTEFCKDALLRGEEGADFTVLGPIEQKKRTRQQRRKKELCLNEKYSYLKANFQYVFIDDIWTTGSTAQAAWRALGRPKLFHVVTIARRALKLADQRKNLI